VIAAKFIDSSCLCLLRIAVLARSCARSAGSAAAPHITVPIPYPPAMKPEATLISNNARAGVSVSFRQLPQSAKRRPQGNLGGRFFEVKNRPRANPVRGVGGDRDRGICDGYVRCPQPAETASCLYCAIKY
jgi:hypothetical protein